MAVAALTARKQQLALEAVNALALGLTADEAKHAQLPSADD
jgi:hypothetical protein